MSIRELQRKEIINTKNCASMGFVIDVEFDPKCGKITSLIVPGPGKICGFFDSVSSHRKKIQSGGLTCLSNCTIF